MKRIVIIFVFCLSAVFTSAQDFDPLVFSREVSAPDMISLDLFLRTSQFIRQFCKEDNPYNYQEWSDAFHYIDSVRGFFEAAPKMINGKRYVALIHFSLSVICKDNSFSIVMNDIEAWIYVKGPFGGCSSNDTISDSFDHRGPSGAIPRDVFNAVCNDHKPRLQEIFEDFSRSLIEGMNLFLEDNSPDWFGSAE